VKSLQSFLSGRSLRFEDPLPRGNRRKLGLGSFKPAAQTAGELGHQFQFAG
jgi:hypothetical protein